MLALWEIARSNSNRSEVWKAPSGLDGSSGRAQGESKLEGLPLARGSVKTLGLPQRGLSGYQTTDLEIKISVSTCLPVGLNALTLACIYLFMYCASVVALVLVSLCS